jgi:TIR domain
MDGSRYEAVVAELSQVTTARLETFFAARGLLHAFNSPGKGWGREKKVNAALAAANNRGDLEDVLLQAELLLASQGRDVETPRVAMERDARNRLSGVLEEARALQTGNLDEASKLVARASMLLRMVNLDRYESQVAALSFETTPRQRADRMTRERAFSLARSRLQTVLETALEELELRTTLSLTPIQQAARAASLAEGAKPEAKKFDVFISHASEDKDAVARSLANGLRDLGLRVWYDEFELRIGDSLRRKIDAGLRDSRFGVVVLSHAFFAKNWPQHELDGLVTLELSGEQVILPLWHNISKDEVMGYSPTLADKVARRTSDATIQQIAEEIASVTREP